MITRRSVFCRLPIIAAALLIVLTGCVRRTVTINTDPQGARVTLNDEEIGTTPVSTDFTWYGDYQVILELDGYETLTTHKKLNAPWYQIPPIDFISEALVPANIHDQHEMTFALEPKKEISRDQLLKQAKEFKERTLFGED